MKNICWQCGKKLMLPSFAEVKDRDGNALRVHKTCKKDADAVLRSPNLGKPPQSFAHYDGNFIRNPGANPDDL